MARVADDRPGSSRDAAAAPKRSLVGVELTVPLFDAVLEPPTKTRPSGSIVGAVAMDSALLIRWDIANQKTVASFPWRHPVPIGELSSALAPVGSDFVAVLSGDEFFQDGARVVRVAGDLGLERWSTELPPGRFVSVAGNQEFIAVGERTQTQLVITTLDAKSGRRIASVTLPSRSVVTGRLRPVVSLAVAHGFVFAGTPDRKLRRFSRNLTPKGGVQLGPPTNEFDRIGGEPPSLAVHPDGLLATDTEDGFVIELDPKLRERRRYPVKLDEAEDIAATREGFVTTRGLGPKGRIFDWQRPSSWKPNEKGAFEVRLLRQAADRTALISSCCGKSAVVPLPTPGTTPALAKSRDGVH